MQKDQVGHKGEASGQMSWVQMIRKYNDRSLRETAFESQNVANATRITNIE
jgi:hypothetical protein